MSEMVILDTHIWFWYINESFDRFPSRWIEQIQQADTIAVSAISCYEIELLRCAQKELADLPKETYLKIAKLK